MNEPKLLTILIPTYNRAKFINRAIESCLNQNRIALNIVVGNNNSTDTTAQILSTYEKNTNIQVINRPSNIGGINNISDLLYNHCHTKYCVVMSDDDYYTDPAYLSDSVKILETYDTVGFVHGEIEYDHNNGITSRNIQRSLKKISTGYEFFINFGSKSHDYAYLMTVVFRTNLAKKNNFFSNPQLPHGDSLAWLKISTESDVAFIERTVARYVMHGNNDITSTDTNRWLDDICFINHAYAHAMENTNWDRKELNSWRQRQRRTYCGKILRMLRQEPTWVGFAKKISQLQRDHHLTNDPILIADTIKSFVSRAFKKRI